MIVRIVCLLFAVVAVSAGLSEQSLALVGLASGIAMLALLGVGKPEMPTTRPWRCLLNRSTWTLPRLSPRALRLFGFAVGGSVLSVALFSPTSFGVVSVASWLAAIGAAIALGLTLDEIMVSELVARGRALTAREYRPEIGAVLVMTLVAFVLRVYHLDTIPLMFHGDEGIVAQIALPILDGQWPPLFIYAKDAGWPQAYMYEYLEAASMWVFGTSIFGLRFVGVVFGALGVPVVYALGRVGWGPAAGALAAWLFVVSHLQIHYSRLAIFVIESVPLMALVMLFLALAHERGRPRTDDGDTAVSRPSGRGVWTLLLLAGMTCGIAQYFYYASRVIPILSALLLLLLWRGGRITFWQAVAFVFGFLVVFAPVGSHFLEMPQRFTGRLNDVSIFQESYVRETVGEGAKLPGALPALFLEQARRSLHNLVRGGDLGGFYTGNTPNFDVVTAAMIWLGLGAALSRVRRYHEASLILWLGLGLITSSVLTIGAHSGQRLLIVTPAAFLLGGVLLSRIGVLAQQFPAQRVDWLAAPVGTTLALWLLATNVSMYFFEYAPRGELAEHAEAAREVARYSDRYRAYFLTGPYFFPTHAAIQFIARGAEMTNLTHASDFQDPPADGRGVMFIVTDDHANDLRDIRARLPGGEEHRVNAPNGRPMFTVYMVPPPG
ncbi:MAG: glycosyltransferase family 39 protein [Chloroflexota bacterium]